jgi:hypothetical protein
MTLSSLTLILAAEGPHGITETLSVTTPLTEASLIQAGLQLLSGEPDSAGRKVVALRASAP